MWPEVAAAAIGGAVGASARFAVTVWVADWFGRDFPWGTLIVNVVGSFLLGMLFVLTVERGELPAVWRAALMVGVLGAFTTFSTFAVDSVALLEQGEVVRAFANLCANVIICFVMAWLGFRLVRLI
ncbi:fluoride efflux transporter CrcB [Arhodomonas sp. AD133]|uniref:fluoride efflux transporter CrcB n=1 Tax=Arhodomonas sp. AD133 TaxID=3415009 RepID=UPI003EBD4330